MTNSDTRPTEQGETRREDAERIVRETILVVPGKIADKYIVAIEAALKDRDDRAAKIADKYVADMRSVTRRTEYGEGCLNAGVYIAAAIRKDSDA